MMNKLKWWWFCCWNPEWCKKHFCRKHAGWGEWTCDECEQEFKELRKTKDVRQHEYVRKMKEKLDKSQQLGKFKGCQH